MTTDLHQSLPQPAPLTSDEPGWALLAHLGALGALFLGGIMGFVVPLIVLAVKGGESPYVRRHAVASLNFQLTLLVAVVVGTVVTVVGAILTLGLGLLVLVPLLLAYAVFALVVMIQASIAAGRGEEYDYPLSLHFVR